MSGVEERNALIESTTLGYEDHGILTAFLNLKYDGAGQGFGGYAFDRYDDTLKKPHRVGCAFGAEFIARVLQTVGVDRWEKLPGKHIRVRAEHTKVHAIGHIIENKWFSPAELASELFGTVSQ